MNTARQHKRIKRDGFLDYLGLWAIMRRPGSREIEPRIRTNESLGRLLRPSIGDRRM